ncbi:ATP-binding cassette domain-containing protein [Acidithiobacillus ferrivorans]|uniref:ATP-binding cassette domain-containing protein n=1 Tax=Acidithiobacillus ferrivorans TaxID=160808 RepID=UPI0011785F4C|nr:ATP-binding cassette domain-containing protein [Acidithiobacillus ferrivorans]
MEEILQHRFSERLKKINEFFRLLQKSLRYAPWSALPIVLGVIFLDSVLFAATPLALRGAVNGLAGHSAGLALGYVALYVVLEAARAGGAAALLNRSLGRLEYGVRYMLATQTYHHLLLLPHATYLTHKIGQLTTIVAKGLQGAVSVQQALIRGLLPAVLQVLLVSGILFGTVPPTIAIIFVVFVVFYGVIFRRNLLLIMAGKRECVSADIEASALATDAVINHETIKLFGAEAELSTRIDAAYSSSRDRWISYAGMTAKSFGQTALVTLICFGAALYLTAEQTLQGAMTVGGFVMVSAYFLRLIEPIRFLFGGLGRLAGGLVDFQQLLSLLSKPAELAAGDPVLPGDGPLALTFDRVAFAYPGRENVLDEISFNVPAGRAVALVGASGAGKSTIARLIFRLYSPDRGAILVDGVAIDRFTPAAIRAAVAIIPQDIVLFHDSIATNIGFARPNASAAEIDDAVRLAGLTPLIERLPDGLRTIVGERGLKLSGGEKQRVAIARAILKRPRLFVLDEATSALDSATERTILDDLARTTAGMTTIMIAHRLSTVRTADEILVIDHGKIVEQGKHAELLVRDGLYAQLWRAQTKHS